jgi:hypothetical protein
MHKAREKALPMGRFNTFYGSSQNITHHEPGGYINSLSLFS